MNSPPAPKATEPRDASIAGGDQRLMKAYAEIKRADEQLARLSEQVARMERNAARAPSAGLGLKLPPGRRRLGALIGLPLAACIIVAAVVLHSSYGGGTKPVAAPSPPQLASASLPPDNPPPAEPAPPAPAELAPPAIQVAAAEPAPPQATPVAQTTAGQATAVAQAAPQDAAPTATVPTATAAPPDPTELLQTMARDLANLQRNIEQLKAAQQQAASDNAKEIAELKASQEAIKRTLAKISDQNLSKASAPPAQAPQPALRKPERTVQAPRARARPRMPPDWYYDDW